MSLDRLLKTLHGWLGFLVMPWIVLAGVTGLYENHGALAEWILPHADFTPALYDGLPARPVNAAGAAITAQGLAKGPLAAPEPVLVLSRPAFEIAGPDETIRVDAATGAYWREGPFRISLYRPDGEVIAGRVNWSKLLVRLHRSGWPSDRLGTWPADLAAGALVVFGLSGIYLFLAPRLRRWRNRRARRA